MVSFVGRCYRLPGLLGNPHFKWTDSKNLMLWVSVGSVTLSVQFYPFRVQHPGHSLTSGPHCCLAWYMAGMWLV